MSKWRKTLRDLRERVGAIKQAKQNEAKFNDHFASLHPGLLAQFAQIKDERGRWIPFDLWPTQFEALQLILDNQYSVLLKARQQGLTWLSLMFAIWVMMKNPGVTVCLFSRRMTEAKDLLARLVKMNARLPIELKLKKGGKCNTEQHEFANGSRVLAFPTSAGDSYTAALVIVDEADLCEDLDRMLEAAKPTIDAGGKLVLISKVNKRLPNSAFKRIYRGAKHGPPWIPYFIPWHARPGRTQEWYERQCQESLKRLTTLDSVHENYPATDIEALAPLQLDKRIPWAILQPCVLIIKTETIATDVVSIPNLRVAYPPEPDMLYAIGGDPAEGNPTSDDSALTVFDKNGRQCAVCQGKFDVDIFADLVIKLSSWYNNARAMIERNNHGHAVLALLRSFEFVNLFNGLDGKRGWLSNKPSKVRLYDDAIQTFRERACRITDEETAIQLASIEGSTSRAPEGSMDDLAIAAVLAIAGVQRLEEYKPWLI